MLHVVYDEEWHRERACTGEKKRLIYQERNNERAYVNEGMEEKGGNRRKI